MTAAATTTWDRGQVRARFEHLAGDPGSVCVPISGEWSISSRLTAGEVKVRSTDLVASGYLVAVARPGERMQLVGLEYLAHERASCSDPHCWAVWQDRADEQAEIPADGMLFARTELTVGDADASYLFHAADHDRMSPAGTGSSEVAL